MKTESEIFTKNCNAKKTIKFCQNICIKLRWTIFDVLKLRATLIVWTPHLQMGDMESSKYWIMEGGGGGVGCSLFQTNFDATKDA